MIFAIASMIAWDADPISMLSSVLYTVLLFIIT